MPTSNVKPTARQREYLVFIKDFTDRRRVPPSFEEIARHFRTSSPSVNGVVKTLEARGFLARVPGAARTLRVLVPEAELRDAGAKAAAPTTALTITVAVGFASVVVERLAPALEGAPRERVHGALSSVVESLEIVLRAAGASDEEQEAARDTILRTASIALGDSTETTPGRRLAWWRRPRPR